MATAVNAFLHTDRKIHPKWPKILNNTAAAFAITRSLEHEIENRMPKLDSVEKVEKVTKIANLYERQLCLTTTNLFVVFLTLQKILFSPLGQAASSG